MSVINNSIDNNDEFIKNSRESIGIKIKEFRLKKGLTQEQLAEEMNISRSTISKIESGKFNCSIDYLTRFSLPLGFNISIAE